MARHPEREHGKWVESGNGTWVRYGLTDGKIDFTKVYETWHDPDYGSGSDDSHKNPKPVVPPPVLSFAPKPPTPPGPNDVIDGTAKRIHPGQSPKALDSGSDNLPATRSSGLPDTKPSGALESPDRLPTEPRVKITNVRVIPKEAPAGELGAGEQTATKLGSVLDVLGKFAGPAGVALTVLGLPGDQEQIPTRTLPDGTVIYEKGGKLHEIKPDKPSDYHLTGTDAKGDLVYEDGKGNTVTYDVAKGQKNLVSAAPQDSLAGYTNTGYRTADGQIIYKDTHGNNYVVDKYGGMAQTNYTTPESPVDKVSPYHSPDVSMAPGPQSQIPSRRTTTIARPAQRQPHKTHSKPSGAIDSQSGSQDKLGQVGLGPTSTSSTVQTSKPQPVFTHNDDTGAIFEQSPSGHRIRVSKGDQATGGHVSNIVHPTGDQKSSAAADNSRSMTSAKPDEKIVYGQGHALSAHGSAPASHVPSGAEILSSTQYPDKGITITRLKDGRIYEQQGDKNPYLASEGYGSYSQKKHPGGLIVGDVPKPTPAPSASHASHAATGDSEATTPADPGFSSSNVSNIAHNSTQDHHGQEPVRTPQSHIPSVIAPQNTGVAPGDVTAHLSQTENHVAQSGLRRVEVSTAHKDGSFTTAPRIENSAGVGYNPDNVVSSQTLNSGAVLNTMKNGSVIEVGPGGGIQLAKKTDEDSSKHSKHDRHIENNSQNDGGSGGGSHHDSSSSAPSQSPPSHSDNGGHSSSPDKQDLIKQALSGGQPSHTSEPAHSEPVHAAFVAPQNAGVAPTDPWGGFSGDPRPGGNFHGPF